MNVIELDNPEISDFQILVDLMFQQMSDIGSSKERSSVESAARNALKSESRTRFFLAKNDEVAIGAAFINICSGIESGGDYVWVNEIQISPDFRKQGLGKKLLDHILRWAKHNNYKFVMGVADQENTSSQALFESRGFSVEDTKWMIKRV